MIQSMLYDSIILSVSSVMHTYIIIEGCKHNQVWWFCWLVACPKLIHDHRILPHVACTSLVILNVFRGEFRGTSDELYTIYDRIDAAANINFSTQFGAATIRERRLFRSARVQAESKSEHKHKDSVLVLLRA